MSRQLTIDSFAFARDARLLEGKIPLADFERLDDVLASVEGEVEFWLEGSRAERGPALLSLTVRGNLKLACQRCLGPIDFQLEVDSLLQPVPENAPILDEELEDDSRDLLPVDGPLDVRELIEDEIILALPVASRHDHCGLPGEKEAGERVSSFSTLAGFKGKLN